MSVDFLPEMNMEGAIYTVVPMGYEIFTEIETVVVNKLRKRDPAYDYNVELITQTLAGNKKLIDVMERGTVCELTEADVEALVTVLDLQRNVDNLLRRSIYHEGVLSGMRMMKESM